jgi:hypothetical protein
MWHTCNLKGGAKAEPFSLLLGDVDGAGCLPKTFIMPVTRQTLLRKSWGEYGIWHTSKTVLAEPALFNFSSSQLAGSAIPKLHVW